MESGYRLEIKLRSRNRMLLYLTEEVSRLITSGSASSLFSASLEMPAASNRASRRALHTSTEIMASNRASRRALDTSRLIMTSDWGGGACRSSHWHSFILWRQVSNSNFSDPDSDPDPSTFGGMPIWIRIQIQTGFEKKFFLNVLLKIFLMYFFDQILQFTYS